MSGGNIFEYLPRFYGIWWIADNGWNCSNGNVLDVYLNIDNQISISGRREISRDPADGAVSLRSTRVVSHLEECRRLIISR